MRRKIYTWYRHPRTTAERRANQDGWCRGKRKPHSLPDTYSDLVLSYTKSWKDSRKTQYRVNKRGTKHSIRINDWSSLWKLKKYCDNHDIPHDYKEIRKFRWVKQYVWVKTGKKKWCIFRKCMIDKTKQTWNGKYRRSYYTDYYIFAWWNNKDICVEYILASMV